METLSSYSQHHNGLIEQDVTTGCWSTATLNAKLIIIQERASDVVQGTIRETAEFRVDLMLQEWERRAYVDLVVARHLAHRAYFF